MTKHNLLLLTILIFLYQQNNPTTDVRHKKPKGSVSFATVLVINDNSEVLLLLRSKGTSFGNGLYSLPGGKIEPGETACQAAQREVQEEVGITVDQLTLVHVVDRQGPETEFYVFVFKADAWQGVPVNCEPDKCDELAWFPLNQLPPNIIPAHRQAITLSQQAILYSEHGW